MYCLDCGTALPEQARFCSQCGLALVEGIEENMPNIAQRDPHQPVLTIKPHFIGWVVLARYIPLQINFTIMGGLLFGLMVVIYHLLTHNLQHPFRPFIFFGSFFFIAVPLLIYIAYRKTIDATEYQFFQDRLEYYDGFWTIQHKILYYKHVADISLRRNIIQRFYDMGTVHIAVPGLGPKHPGLFIADIEHPVAVFEQIQNLVRSY